jgi:hypothetical protein
VKRLSAGFSVASRTWGVNEYRKTEPSGRKGLQHQLSGLEAAARALGDSTNRELKDAGKRVLSAAGRAAIAKAAKKRWAKVTKQAKKVAG